MCVVLCCTLDGAVRCALPCDALCLVWSSSVPCGVVLQSSAKPCVSLDVLCLPFSCLVLSCLFHYRHCLGMDGSKVASDASTTKCGEPSVDFSKILWLT